MKDENKTITKRKYTKRTNKMKVTVDSIRELVKRLDELEAENEILRKALDETKAEAENWRKQLFEYDEQNGEQLSIFERRLLLAKSLINIPDNMKDCMRELVKARLAYWEAIADDAESDVEDKEAARRWNLNAIEFLGSDLKALFAD